MYNENTRGLYI